MDCAFCIKSEKEDELLILLLTHINEIHDPNFVGRCEDDLLIEYDQYVAKFQSLIID